MLILALHGFTRGPQNLDGFAVACHEQGWMCFRPKLAPRSVPVLMNSRRHLNALTRSLVPAVQGQPVTIVGHSAGSAAGSWIATQLIEQGMQVIGIVMVDGNDSPNHLIEQSWAALADIPIRAVLAPPSPCNRQGLLQKYLDENRPGCVTVIPGSGHGDIELLPSQMYRKVCGDSSTPETKQRVLAAVISAVKEIQATI